MHRTSPPGERRATRPTASLVSAPNDSSSARRSKPMSLCSLLTADFLNKSKSARLIRRRTMRGKAATRLAAKLEHVRGLRKPVKSVFKLDSVRVLRVCRSGSMLYVCRRRFRLCITGHFDVGVGVKGSTLGVLVALPSTKTAPPDSKPSGTKITKLFPLLRVETFSSKSSTTR